MAAEEKYIQVGVTALRDPATGEFLPAVPLYIKAEDGAVEGEEKLIEGISHLLALRFKAYVDGLKKAGVQGGKQSQWTLMGRYVKTPGPGSAAPTVRPSGS